MTSYCILQEQMKTLYSYKDIVLLPSYSDIKSRSELDVTKEFLGWKFNSVAIPANMKCTIDFKKAVQLSEAGYFYVLHRFYGYDEILKWVVDNQLIKTISISLGVTQEDYDLIDKLANRDLRVDFITIDVAHGHHILVKEMIEYVKKMLKYTNVIAGNVGSVAAAKDLASWGADAVKIGLSMGKSCTTYNCTGVGTPMFSIVDDIAQQIPNDIPIIADGQIREVGDVCKALVAGADMVMIGSEFAKCEDSPADVIGGPLFNSKNKKIFFGSASSANKGHSNYVEGQTVYLDMRNETYFDYFNRINQGIQSCMSYCGVRDIDELYSMEYAIHTNN